MKKLLKQLIKRTLPTKFLVPQTQTSNLNSNVIENQVAELRQQHTELYDIVQYQHYKISDLRSKLRYLVSEKINELPLKNKTYASFDFQWTELNEGKFLLSDDSFKPIISQYIAQYSSLDESWFKNKRVLDAGCGQGRFTYGFAKLGAQVCAVDQSENAVKNAREVTQEFPNIIEIKQHDLLKPLHFNEKFDLVWSYGVLHHTGGTYAAFQNIHPLVKEGGYLFLMLYGEPKWGDVPSFREQLEYSRLRHITRSKSHKEKIDLLLNEKSEEYLHGWFDAISPHINDTYSFEEIESWLIDAGFTDIKRTSESANHHIIARKK